MKKKLKKIKPHPEGGVPTTTACMHAHTCLLHEPEFDVAQQEQIIGAFGPPGATPAVPQMQYGYGSLKRFFFG